MFSPGTTLVRSFLELTEHTDANSALPLGPLMPLV
jgi:hypothetical protein